MNKLFINFKNKPGGTVSELLMFLKETHIDVFSENRI